MNILVTGGAGFIGSHIVEAYLDEGHKVFIADNLTTGRLENLPESGRDAHLMEADLRFEKDVEAAFREAEAVLDDGEHIDVVNHHAALASVQQSHRDPLFCYEQNVVMTFRILEAMKQWRVPVLIFASTGGAVYGDPQMLPATEGTSLAPTSPYGSSKVMCERLINDVCKAEKITFTNLRYGNCFGPRQLAETESGVIATFITKMLAGEQPVIFGEGDHTRDYLFVQDAARANVLALENNQSGAFNIGTGVPRSVLHIYKGIAVAMSLLGIKQIPEWEQGDPVEEVKDIYLDATLAAKFLGWTSGTGFGKGLRLTIESFM